jgi:hypothetical protein
MSWCVVKSRDDIDYYTPIEVIGAFSTEEEAKKYALRSFYLGRDVWDRLPTSLFHFEAVKWEPRSSKGKEYYE